MTLGFINASYRQPVIDCLLVPKPTYPSVTDRRQLSVHMQGHRLLVGLTCCKCGHGCHGTRTSATNNIETKCNAVDFPWKEHGLERGPIGRCSDTSRMQSRCESKRLFSVLSQMYQSCIYIRCETIQRLVHIKTQHRGGGGEPG